LCGLGDKIKSFFVLTLVEDFEEMTVLVLFFELSLVFPVPPFNEL
jgi:hypothetical protein